jgi:phage-related protein
MPAMVKAGFDTKDKQTEFLERIFNRNAAETGALLGVNPLNVERTAQSIKNADTLGNASASVAANNPLVAMAQVGASLSNLASNLGQSVPGITQGLTNLAGAIDWMAHLNDNPALKAMDLAAGLGARG